MTETGSSHFNLKFLNYLQFTKNIYIGKEIDIIWALDAI